MAADVAAEMATHANAITKASPQPATAKGNLSVP
jgi:hypothetical protein